MNTFKIGDRVSCPDKKRSNGSVIHVICGVCKNCEEKRYGICCAEVKDKLLVSFPVDGTKKRYKYHYSELILEPPMPVKTSSYCVDLSPKDIRRLGEVEIDLPEIAECEDAPVADEQNNATQVIAIKKKPHLKPNGGMFFDQFLSLRTQMEYPI